MGLLTYLSTAHDLEERPLLPPSGSSEPRLPRDCVLLGTLLLSVFGLRIGSLPVREIACANLIASRYVPPSFSIIKSYTSPLTPQPWHLNLPSSKFIPADA